MQANVPRSNLADRVVLGTQKQKRGPICNFFAIRDSLPPSQRGNEPFCSRFAAFLGRNPRFGAPWQSLIAKKLQNNSDFCFCSIQIVTTEQIPRIRNGQIAITGRILSIRNGQIAAMGRIPPIPCLQNQQKPTGPHQSRGEGKGFALLCDQPNQGKSNTHQCNKQNIAIQIAKVHKQATCSQ